MGRPRRVTVQIDVPLSRRQKELIRTVWVVSLLVLLSLFLLLGGCLFAGVVASFRDPVKAPPIEPPEKRAINVNQGPPPKAPPLPPHRFDPKRFNPEDEPLGLPR